MHALQPAARQRGREPSGEIERRSGRGQHVVQRPARLYANEPGMISRIEPVDDTAPALHAMSTRSPRLSVIAARTEAMASSGSGIAHCIAIPTNRRRMRRMGGRARPARCEHLHTRHQIDLCMLPECTCHVAPQTENPL